jgi:hypothetical protein
MTFFGLSLLTTLLIVWAVFTSALILLMIYRSIVEMHEDDQLFLDESHSQAKEDQTETLARLQKLRPYIRTLSALSGVLILVIAGIWLYQGIVIRGSL